MSKNQHPRTFQTTKKLNLVPTKITACPLSRVSVFVAGTKLSPICSPKMYVEHTPNQWSPASAGSKAYSKSASRQRIPRDFCNFLPGHNSFRSSDLSIPPVTGGQLRCAEYKISLRIEKNDRCETLRLFYRRSNADFVEQTSVT
jgi:hypothetical protein